jgi:hypothetical protein
MIENKNLNNTPDGNNAELKGLCSFLDAILNITTNKIKRITLLMILVVFLAVTRIILVRVQKC